MTRITLYRKVSLLVLVVVTHVAPSKELFSSDLPAPPLSRSLLLFLLGISHNSGGRSLRAIVENEKIRTDDRRVRRERRG